jgi:hypothetical protein
MKEYYNLGKRDAVAEILMQVRLTSPVETLRKIAEELLVIDKDHPHAKWVLDNLK